MRRSGPVRRAISSLVRIEDMFTIVSEDDTVKGDLSHVPPAQFGQAHAHAHWCGKNQGVQKRIF